MSANAIHVTGISQTTAESHLKDFFTFCGKIDSIDYDSEKHAAKIHFEKPSAAKTALMLNGGTLDGAHLTIVSDAQEVASVKEVEAEVHHTGEHIDQADKPRAGIAAEYLAKGYTLSDQILQRAIELDQQHGISNRFLSYIHGLDTSLGSKVLGPDKTLSAKAHETIQTAAQQAKAVDEQRGISKSATDYYAKALSSPFGQKVKAFYTSTSKQVLDIHEEARRIHENHKTSAHGPTPSSTGVGTSKPPVDPSVQSVNTAGVEAPTAGVQTAEAPTAV